MAEPDYPPARVSPRVVILSICGVWLCYFVLITLRGVIVGFDLNWAFVSRRLAVTLASIAVTGTLWPLLERLDARPLWIKAAVILIGAMPPALLLAEINQWAFADVETVMIQHAPRSGARTGVRIQDATGNVLVDIAPPAPPVPPEPHAGTATPPQAPAAKPAGATITVVRNAPEPFGGPDSRWAELTDVASSRYFLLLAWAALYVALVNGEQLRGAERRESGYRRAAAAAELRSLRYQVNPHFLFNTLNSLSALVITGRIDDAERMIQTLATFYRRTLAGDPTADLSLADEIALQQLYLEIEVVRFPDRLKRAVTLPPALGDARVPGMILQPLVENAVKYAVAASTRPVTITITAAQERDELVLTVTDDGPISGGEVGAGRAAPAHGLGVGLSNVRDRLHARFGGAASLDSGARAEGGFATVIRMPLLRGAAADAPGAPSSPARAASW